MLTTNFSKEKHCAKNAQCQRTITQSPEWAAYHGTGNTLKLNRSKYHDNKANQQRLPSQTREN